MFRNLHVALTECQGDCKPFLMKSFCESLTKRIERGSTAPQDDVHSRRMRSDKQRVLVTWVESQGPDPRAWQMKFAHVNSGPCLARIGRPIHTAAGRAVLISVAGKDFVCVPWVDQNAAEIAKRQVAAAPRPVLATVMGQIESLLRSDIDVGRALRILRDDVYRGRVRDARKLFPRFAAIP